MILVLTTEAGDYSHIKFIDWLEYYKSDYEILSGESILKGKVKVTIKDGAIFINDRNYSEEVKVVFNRRWLTTNQIFKVSNDDKFNSGIKKILSSELFELRKFFGYYLKKALWIPDLNNTNVNKLQMLYEAKKAGLSVPDFLVTNSKKDLLSFVAKHQQVITKAIGNFPGVYFGDDFLVNSSYTKVISKKFVENLPETFFVSFFQKYVDKKQEFRVLYFNGTCYPVEILTQENDFSKIDSRVQGKENVRMQSTILAKEYENKLVKFMKNCNLIIGCIDVIKSFEGDYYFLEVNPVGQISGYSLRANLNFERDIVKQIVDIDEKT